MSWVRSGKAKGVLEKLGVKVDWERIALGGASAGANVVSLFVSWGTESLVANLMISPFSGSCDGKSDFQLQLLKTRSDLASFVRQANKLASPTLDASLNLKLSKLLLFVPVLDNEASPSNEKYASWKDNQFCP